MVNTRVIYNVDSTYVTILLTPSSALLGVILAPNQEVFATVAGLKIRNALNQFMGFLQNVSKSYFLGHGPKSKLFKTWFKI